MARLVTVPPVPLIESYYLCTHSLESALLNAIGTSASFAGLLLSLFFGAIGFCFIRIQNHRLRHEGQFNRLLDKSQKQALQNDATHHIISGLVKELRLHRELLADWQAQIDLEYDPTLNLALTENRRKWDQTVGRMAAFKKLYKSLRPEDPDQLTSLLSRDSAYVVTSEPDKRLEAADSDAGFDSDSDGEECEYGEEYEYESEEEQVVQHESTAKSRLKDQELALAKQMTKRFEQGKSVDEFWCVSRVKPINGKNVKTEQSEVQGCL
jgi:hypothetical protein